MSLLRWRDYKQELLQYRHNGGQGVGITRSHAHYVLGSSPGRETEIQATFPRIFCVPSTSQQAQVLRDVNGLAKAIPAVVVRNALGNPAVQIQEWELQVLCILFVKTSF